MADETPTGSSSPDDADLYGVPTDAADADTEELPDVDKMTLWQFIRSFAFRIVGLWMFTTSVLITSLAIVGVSVWKGAWAGLWLSTAFLGRRVSKSIAKYGHISRKSLSVAMADSTDDIENNYAIQQSYNFTSLQDQPKGTT